MLSLLGALFIILVYVIKIGLFIGLVMLLTYFPTYLHMLWVRFLRFRNRLILTYVSKKRVAYCRERLGTNDPIAWSYESTNIYNVYQEMLPVIIDKGGGNCRRCHTLTLPNMFCPKCGNLTTEQTLDYYHEDVKEYVAKKNNYKYKPEPKRSSSNITQVATKSY